MLYVYDNWSAYDELSDNIPLTEELAMRQFDEVVRLRSHGVRIDAYLMDAFWYERSGGYLTWKPDRWPEGPGCWLEACAREGILPGLWFPANTIFEIDLPESWKSSAASDGWGLCCFEGGFLQGFIDVLTHWYEKGIRIFKFDFADFGAAPDAAKLRMLPSEIRSRNVAAYREGLIGFKKKCPDAVLLAYNGFEEAEFMTWTDRPTRRVLNPAWLEVFHTVYCGDPRPADIPLPNFWRTLDLYADHMVRFLSAGGFPLEGIDDCAFMMGVAGTCYHRGKANWKTSLILSLARSTKVHMTLGNLEQFSAADTQFIASAQRFFEIATSRSLVGSPNEGSYLVGSDMGSILEADESDADTFLCMVNSSLSAKDFSVEGSLIYADGAFDYESVDDGLEGGRIKLAPGGMALFGRGRLASIELKPDAGSHHSLEPLDAAWQLHARTAEAELAIPENRDLHLIFRQVDAKGLAVRTSGGAPPDGRSMSGLLVIQAQCQGTQLEVERPDDHVLWCGLSWAYGIVRAANLPPHGTVRVRMSTSDAAVSKLIPQAFSGVEINHPEKALSVGKQN